MGHTTDCVVYPQTLPLLHSNPTLSPNFFLFLLLGYVHGGQFWVSPIRHASWCVRRASTSGENVRSRGCAIFCSTQCMGGHINARTIAPPSECSSVPSPSGRNHHKTKRLPVVLFCNTPCFMGLLPHIEKVPTHHGPLNHVPDVRENQIMATCGTRVYTGSTHDP